MSAKPPNLDTIFCAAIEIASADERANYMQQACGSDDDLRARVEVLVAAHFRAGTFMESRASRFPVGSGVSGTNGLPPTIDAPIAERPGALIGGYKLLEQIGEGGFGIVFMAEQQAPIRRKVALKILKPGMDSRQVLARFEAERQALALMDHPNIAHVFDGSATESGRPYFVMELVRGIPITEFCDQSKLPVRERLELFVNVCQAVQHAHQKGIIHRDIKPSNVLVTLHDGTPVVKVIDFGVAKAMGQQLTEKTLFTQFAQFIGTPTYMSPEQAALSGLDVDTRSDIYSLGVLLYELLTGKTPFDEKRLREVSFEELLRIIREEEPVKPSTRISTLGQAATTVSAQRKSDPKRLSQLFRGELDWIVIKALEKDRNRRYESASALAADVQRYLRDEAVLACPPSAGYLLRKIVRRHRKPVLAAGIVFAVLLAGMAGTIAGLVRAERAKEAEKKAKLTAQQKEADSEAVLDFLEKQIIAAARPEGLQGGQGRNITLREALEKALPVVDKKFADRPLIEARLRMTMGTSFRHLGENQIALEQYQGARAIYAAQLGPRDPNTLESMHGIALCYGEMGKREEACALNEETLALRKELLGPDHIDTLRSMNNLANVYIDLGRDEQARQLFQETLDRRLATLGPDHTETIDAKWGLASAYFRLNRSDEALTLREEVVASKRKLYGDRNPGTFRSMHNLAMSYSSVNRHDDAIRLYREILPLYQEILSPTNSDTVSCMGNLAWSYFWSGQYGEALRLREEILPLRIAASTRIHFYTFRAMWNLAASFASVGRYEDALKLHQETLELRQKHLRPNDKETIQSIWSVGNSYTNLGQYEEALKRYDRALELRKKTAGADSHGVVEAMYGIAFVRIKLKEYTKAETVLTQALAIARAPKCSTDFPLLAPAVQSLLGYCLVADGKFKDAEPELQACLADYEQKDDNGWMAAFCQATLGSALLGQQKYGEAEMLLLAGFERMNQKASHIQAPDQHLLGEAFDRVIQLYDAWGKKDQANAWRQKRLEIIASAWRGVLVSANAPAKPARAIDTFTAMPPKPPVDFMNTGPNSVPKLNGARIIRPMPGGKSGSR